MNDEGPPDRAPTVHRQRTSTGLTWCGVERPPDDRWGKWEVVTCEGCIEARLKKKERPPQKPDPTDADPFAHVNEGHLQMGAVLAAPVKIGVGLLMNRLGYEGPGEESDEPIAGWCASLAAAADVLGWFPPITGPWAAVGLSGVAMGASLWKNRRPLDLNGRDSDGDGTEVDGAGAGGPTGEREDAPS